MGRRGRAGDGQTFRISKEDLYFKYTIAAQQLSEMFETDYVSWLFRYYGAALKILSQKGFMISSSFSVVAIQMITAIVTAAGLSTITLSRFLQKYGSDKLDLMMLSDISFFIHIRDVSLCQN